MTPSNTVYAKYCISQQLTPITYCSIFQHSISKNYISHRKEKDEDASVSVSIPNYSSTKDLNTACNIVIKEDDEEIDISEDEDELAYDKTHKLRT